MEIRHCVREDDIHIILKAFHDETYGGDFVDNRIGHNAVRMGYFWPTMFQEEKKYAQACDSFQRMGQPK